MVPSSEKSRVSYFSINYESNILFDAEIRYTSLIKLILILIVLSKVTTLLLKNFVQGKLNTKERLRKIGVIFGDDNECVLCGKEEENIIHLFIKCDYAKTLWSAVQEWWGVSVQQPVCQMGLF